MPEEKKRFSIVRVIVLLAASLFIIWFFLGGGIQQQAARDMRSIHDQVARDAVTQYEMVTRSGTPIDICVQAGMAAAAFLQAKDEPNYVRWKDTEAADCKKAGVPR